MLGGGVSRLGCIPDTTPVTSCLLLCLQWRSAASSVSPQAADPGDVRGRCRCARVGPCQQELHCGAQGRASTLLFPSPPLLIGAMRKTRPKPCPCLGKAGQDQSPGLHRQQLHDLVSINQWDLSLKLHTCMAVRHSYMAL